MEDRATRDVFAAAVGGMLALVRVHVADREKGALLVGVHAAEAALWVRALDDIFRALDPGGVISGPAPASEPGMVSVSDGRPSYWHGQVARGVRVVGNKGVHDMIFPTAESPRYDFLRTLTISSGYTYEWARRERWEHLVNPGRPLHGDEQRAYDEGLVGMPVVASLRIALGVYRERAALHGISAGDVFDPLDSQGFVGPHF